MKSFGPRPVAAPDRTNATLARDFLELSFAMESGRALPTFSRFEGDITLRLRGDTSLPNVEGDLDALLTRLRREAGLNIRRVRPDQPARITVEIISRRQLKRVVPQAACFVVPNATGWDDFLRLRRSNALDWARLTTRQRAAIFLPGDVSPQEIRDCLHEELAQALGPLNDLYRLPDSVFNDDNIHAVLTGFDMMMLRITYAPDLRSGMSKAQVAQRLPGILSRINPGHGQATIAPPVATPREWVDAIETAIGPRRSMARRRDAAEHALIIAQAEGWEDTRMAFSLFVLARLSLPQESDLALASFFRASAIYNASEATHLHAAHVAMQLAAFALSAGDADAALRLIDHHLDTVTRSENAALLSTLLLMKAEALDYLGREDEAARFRRDGLGWARYGFGSGTQVNARASEIANLRPPPRQS